MTGFPINTMVGFGCYVGEKCDENGEKKWTIVEKININDNTLISQSRYNDSIIEKRYIYIYIDIKRNKIFSSINNNQIINDKKYEELEEKEREGKKTISNLQIKVDELSLENSQNKKKISKIMNENRILTERNQKEEDRRKKHEKDKKDFENDFEKIKKKIKDEKVQEWKKKINQILIKNYINEFEKKYGNKKKSTIYLLFNLSKILPMN